MKKNLSIVLILTILFSTITPTYASTMYNANDENIIAEIQEEEGYNTRSSRFYYEYEETDYSHHMTGITTEGDIEAGLQMASDELTALSFVVAALLGAPVVSAMETNASKAVLKATVKKFLSNSKYVAIVPGGGTTTLNHWVVRASKVITEKKTKTRYRVKISNGGRSVGAQWVIYRTKNYYRKSKYGSWIYNDTTTQIFKVR